MAWLASGRAGYIVSAARLGPDGEPLDSAAIQLTPDSLFQWSVAAGSDGDNYLVVWDGDIPLTDSTMLGCARVNGEGAILDSVPITIARSRGSIADIAVAYLDGTYLVAWTDWRADGDVYACRVLADGTVLDTGGFAVCAQPAQQREPGVAAGTDRFMVAWSEFRDSTFDIYATAVDTGGQTGIGNSEPERLTRRAVLRAWPNPARGQVRFEPEGTAPVRIFDSAGRLMRSLPLPQPLTPGPYSLSWDGRDNAGRRVAPGLYFVTLESGAGRARAKVVLSR